MSFVRHFNGRNSGRIALQAKRGKIIAVEWTWKGHRICRTRKEADQARRNWQRWYRRRGWEVRGNRATGPNGERHVCEVTEYDAKTLKRIYPEFKPRPERPAREAKPKRRTGRKPIAA